VIARLKKRLKKCICAPVDKRKGWLRDLKVGDRVVYFSPDANREFETEVTEITPTGYIRASGVLYWPHGLRRGHPDYARRHEAKLLRRAP